MFYQFTVFYHEIHFKVVSPNMYHVHYVGNYLFWNKQTYIYKFKPFLLRKLFWAKFDGHVTSGNWFITVIRDETSFYQDGTSGREIMSRRETRWDFVLPVIFTVWYVNRGLLRGCWCGFLSTSFKCQWQGLRDFLLDLSRFANVISQVLSLG